MTQATLKSLLEAHPEYADLPIVIYDERSAGYWHVQHDDPYVDEQHDNEYFIPKTNPVLVFSSN